MNESLKKELISAVITFVSTFLLVAGGNLATTGTTEITLTVVVGIAMAAVRAAIKAVTGQLGK